ncbi:MAG: hypothetical protein OMM_07174 [Candidatus Magnetoglobus multicellularis str. Araruama]|uniref:Uncharacterized protein n=1 Tax=Candidatus Magnetoglobus multicellularis str. Araruama TaxID=890399 RepID=A0A1V1PE49_9BACT|nr:MAG: hypothetical protein OMM_07174 [Candidatus Magnetoglobus multicellularis str. Araruama]
MNTENISKITILVFIIFLASIIPFCMIFSSRDSLVQNRVHELVIARQENELGLNKIFKIPEKLQTRKDNCCD